MNLKQYQEQLEESYPTRELVEGISDETFFCAMYLPKGTLDICIKHKDLDGVNFLRYQQKNIKHLSINKIDISHKMIKKVKEIRHFHFKTSIFCKFRFDTDDTYDKAFECDKELTKIPKFVKDKED